MREASLFGNARSFGPIQQTPQRSELRTGTVDTQKVLDLGLEHVAPGGRVGLVPNHDTSGPGIAHQLPAIAVGASVDVFRLWQSSQTLTDWSGVW